MAYLRFGEKPDLIVYTEYGHLTYLPSAAPESQRHISFTYQVASALRARRRARAISPGSATIHEILEPLPSPRRTDVIVALLGLRLICQRLRTELRRLKSATALVLQRSAGN